MIRVVVVVVVVVVVKLVMRDRPFLPTPFTYISFAEGEKGGSRWACYW